MKYLRTGLLSNYLWLFCLVGFTPLASSGEAPTITLAPCCLPGSSPVVELFADTAAWSWVNDSAWTWQGEGEQRELQLLKQTGSKPTFRSPFNLAWFEPREWKDFTLTCEAQLTLFNQGNNDLCIAFGKMEAYRFYYAHIGEKADGVHHQFHVVDNADRKAITTYRTAGMEWKENVWHQVRVVRNSETGDMAVYVNNQEAQVLSARDKTLTWGQIGLGSFDDLGKFRKVKIQGISRAKETK
jgi:hypothetical protein